MPFQFQWLCEVLEEIYRNRHRRTITTARTHTYEHQIVYNWYQRYSHRIERSGPSAIAFLSCVLPERRPDRAYNLQAKRLSRIFGRALGLGYSRAQELDQWQRKGGTDFATCVELVLKQCENNPPAPGKEVTLEEIDEALNLLAAHAPSSSPAIRAKRTNASPVDLLAPILRRLTSQQVKWFTRMLTKSYAPVQIPEYQALHGFHFMLPNLLALQSSFEAAIDVISQDSIRNLPPRPDKNYEYALHSLVASQVQPRLGVMISRQPYHKARSIKNCCSIADGRQMSIERKYDGEYCQIHIDLSKGYDCIQIFSKSAKDSTNDRIRLHGAIKDALRIGRANCRIQKCCIVEGELLVWSSTKHQIQPFHKIRKYVKHGGRDIGTTQDSPPRRDEQLMVAFYDILMMDNNMLLSKPHKVRRQHLKAVLHTIEGRAILGERQTIDFRDKRANVKLREMFARAITQRWEGLVLKSLDEPYFSWNSKHHGIKLKKDYISKLGDTADLCIVGGRRDPHAELRIGHGSLWWTSFYIGAICNKEAMRRFDAKPGIKIIDILTHHSMPSQELFDLNRLGYLVQTEYTPSIIEFDVEMGCAKMPLPTELFKTPFIVEIMGAGFEKQSDCSYYTLRFPRKVDRMVKLHTDRTLLSTMSFDELQNAAEQSFVTSEDAESQEDAQWIERLIKADGKRQAQQSVSQRSSSNSIHVNAPAMSLSPLSPARGMPHVFVRPDTEEPETQVVSNTDSSFVSSSHAIDTKGNGRRNPTLRSILPKSYSPRKRRREVLGEMNRDEPGRKRHCSANTSQDKSRELQKTTNIIVDLTTPSPQQMLIIPVPDVTMDPHESISNKSQQSMPHSAWKYQTPPGPNAKCASGEGTPDSAVPTPESTLLMRNIMALQGHPAFADGSYSPMKTLNTLFPSRPAPQQQSPTEDERAGNRPLLPTPPSSSPLAQRRLANVPASCAAQWKAHNGTIVSDRDKSNCQISKSGIQAQSAQSEYTCRPDQETEAPPTCKSANTAAAPILILNSQPDVLSHLSLIKSTFIFSSNHFLNLVNTYSVYDYPPTPILLVNCTDLSTTVAALEALARSIQSRIRTLSSSTALSEALARYSDKILVFDQRILQHMSINGWKLDVESLSTLDYRDGKGVDAALFCGVLSVYERVAKADTNGRNRDVRDGNQVKIGVRFKYEFGWMKQ